MSPEDRILDFCWNNQIREVPFLAHVKLEDLRTLLSRHGERLLERKANTEEALLSDGILMAPRELLHQPGCRSATIICHFSLKVQILYQIHLYHPGSLQTLQGWSFKGAHGLLAEFNTILTGDLLCLFSLIPFGSNLTSSAF